jgi:two-component system, NtrC family, response regulator HydG
MVLGLKDKTSILIVDDDVDMAETLSDILEAKGLEVVVAHDGYKAVEKVKAKMFEIILMDIKMPFMNGVESYKKIKLIQPQTVVVMMTAYAAQDLVAEALREGVYGVWYKPVEVKSVVELVQDTPKKGALLLIVDDDLSTCETLVDILQIKGYRLTQVSNGEEAKIKISEKDYDLVFVDAKMPVMNGLETYLELRKIRPNIKAIMVTAYRQEVDAMVEEALRKNLYTCLYKPIEVNKLLKIVEKILAEKPNVESLQIGVN